MKLFLNCTAIIIASTILSCGRTSESRVADMQLQNINADPKNLKDKAEESKEYTTDTIANQTTPPQITLQSGKPAPAYDWDKKIIKTANITLELKDYKSFNSAIHNTTKQFGAYIANEQQSQQDDKIQNTISIKVPVDQFEDLMNALPEQGVKVIEKQISSQDVTGDVVDSKARVQARKQVRERYLELLKQSKTMKDILEVQQEVNTVQEDIESGNGKVQYLNHQSVYSTINLNYYQYLTTAPDPNKEPPGFITKLKEAFNDGSAVISGLILMLVTFWPVVLIGLVVWLIYKGRKTAPVTTPIANREQGI